MTVQRKIILGGFIFLFLIPMIGTLFSGINGKSLMALMVVVFISIVAIGLVFSHALSKSSHSLSEEIERAQNIIDRALDGDIDDEFIITKNVVEDHYNETW